MKCISAVLSFSVVAAGPFYIGCYADKNPGRDLPVFFCSNGKSSDGIDCASDPKTPAGGSSFGHAKNPEACSVMCSGFKFFGLQNGGECFCGDDYGNQGGKKPEAECPFPCWHGDSGSGPCGGSARNSIYVVNNTDSDRGVNGSASAH